MKATSHDVLRLFPGAGDHAVSEILSSGASLSDLEAALILLQDDDGGLVEIKRRHGDRLNRLVQILEEAGIQVPNDRDV